MKKKFFFKFLQKSPKSPEKLKNAPKKSTKDPKSTKKVSNKSQKYPKSPQTA